MDTSRGLVEDKYKITFLFYVIILEDREQSALKLHYLSSIKKDNLFLACHSNRFTKTVTTIVAEEHLEATLAQSTKYSRPKLKHQISSKFTKLI